MQDRSLDIVYEDRSITIVSIKFPIDAHSLNWYDSYFKTFTGYLYIEKNFNGYSILIFRCIIIQISEIEILF